MKILTFKYLQIRRKACSSPFLATNQSFPRKSSNTASATIVPHMQSAQRFHMKSRLRFIPHPLRVGIKFPTHWKILIIKFPPPRDCKGVKCPGYARGGEGIWPIHTRVLNDLWRRYCRTKVLDFSRVEEELLPTELTPNSLIMGIKKSTFSIGRKLTKDLQVFNRATESFPTELLLIVKKEVKKRWQCSICKELL